MIIAKPKKLKYYTIEGIDSYKAGEWNGQRSSHWQGGKQYYACNVVETKNIQSQKKQFINKIKERCSPCLIPLQKKHYSNNGAIKIGLSSPDLNKINCQKKHYNNINLSNSIKIDNQRSNSFKRVYPNILNSSTNHIYNISSNYNVYNPSKNEYVSLNFIAYRNNLPSIQDNKILDYKYGSNLGYYSSVIR